eukprot:3133702-Amphidinium_carterae.1
MLAVRLAKVAPVQTRNLCPGRLNCEVIPLVSGQLACIHPKPIMAWCMIQHDTNLCHTHDIKMNSSPGQFCNRVKLLSAAALVLILGPVLDLPVAAQLEFLLCE